jgi:hypothetical protein
VGVLGVFLLLAIADSVLPGDLGWALAMVALGALIGWLAYQSRRSS